GAAVRLAELARVMNRSRRLVVAVWLVGLAGLVMIAGRWGGEHTADYQIRGSESAAAATLLADRLPALSGALVQVVVHAPDGVDVPETAERIDGVVEAIAAVDHVRDVQPLVVGADGTVALATVQLDGATEQVPVETVETIME